MLSGADFAICIRIVRRIICLFLFGRLATITWKDEAFAHKQVANAAYPPNISNIRNSRLVFKPPTLFSYTRLPTKHNILYYYKRGRDFKNHFYRHCVLTINIRSYFVVRFVHINNDVKLGIIGRRWTINCYIWTINILYSIYRSGWFGRGTMQSPFFFQNILA